MNDLPGAIDQLGTHLEARLEALERRVHALEHPSYAPISPPLPDSLPVLASSVLPEQPAAEAVRFAQAGGMFAVLGKAMLGIAGAYLLRAAAEFALLPRLAAASIAFLYAIAWLVWAARTPAAARFARFTYTCTSALILAPMLWELTMNYKVLPAAATAGALAAFVCIAFALAWKRDLALVLGVAYGTAAAAALALGVASHQSEPFIAVLLLTILLGEYALLRGRKAAVRWLVAASADLAIWALIYLYFSPPNTREDYPVLGPVSLLAPGLLLFLVFAASVILKTALCRKNISAFETIQTMIAFFLAAVSLLCFGPPASTVILGILCLGLSAAGYIAVFLVFGRAAERRNDVVFATWSAGLFVAGCWLCLPPVWMTACLCVAAIAAAGSGARMDRVVLELHSAVFLLMAAAASGLLVYLSQALAGTLPGVPGLGVCMASACAVLCYAAALPRAGEPWMPQALHLAVALLAACAAAALLIVGLAHLLALSVPLGAHHLAFIRTFTICAAAVALAFSGAHWRRIELTRIGYAALALIAVKLVLEDLRHGHLEYIAASIFLFAITLIAVPRVARARQHV
jgi:hypothetical protein